MEKGRVQFVKTIETTVGRLNFYFNSIPISTVERINVSVTERNNLISILLEQVNYSWKIINLEECPEWIKPIETIFNTEITAYLAGV